MEKKIEAPKPMTFKIHDCEDHRNKIHFNSEKYTGCKCMICDTILEFNWKVTPSSLPTDEDMPKFNHYMTSVDSSDIDYNDVGYYVDKSGFDSAVKKAYELGLRTNFSSEKCEGEAEKGILDFVLKNFVIKYDEGADRFVNIHDRKIYNITQVHEIFKQGKQQH